MRGLAALVVVIHHIKLIFYKRTCTAGLPWFLLHPLVADHQSVMFFFLLGGFVLTLPMIRDKKQSYSVFIQKRFLRIYGPYFAALALAVAGCSMWHGQFGTRVWAQPVSWPSVLNSVLFLGNYDYARFNIAFWSLVYEMRISIIFPLLYVLTLRLSNAFLGVLIATLVAEGV